MTKLFWVKIILEKLSSKSIFTFVKVVSKSILETRHKDTFKKYLQDTRCDSIFYLEDTRYDLEVLHNTVDNKVHCKAARPVCVFVLSASQGQT